MGKSRILSKLVEEKDALYQIAGKNIPFLNSLTSLIVSHEIRKSKPDSYHKPSNCLIIGPSGVGKTFLVDSILKRLEIPNFVVDAKQFSEVGYQGKDIYDIFNDIGQNIDLSEDIDDVVIIIDEFDKLQEKNSLNRDVSGAGVQNSLLKILDGIDIEINTGSRFPKIVNTKQFIFIFIGAFSFFSDYDNSKSKLIDNGFSVELTNRISNVFELKPYTLNEYYNYFTLNENDIFENFVECYNALGLKVEFIDYSETLKAVIQEGLKIDGSFRGIEFVVNNMLNGNLINNFYSSSDNSYITVEKLEVRCVKNSFVEN